MKLLKTNRLSGATAALLALTVGAVASLSATPAQAAVVTPIDTDSITISNQTNPDKRLALNDTVTIDANWSIKSASAGDTFTLGFPSALKGVAETVELTAASTVYGTCEVSESQMVCTLKQAATEVSGQLRTSAVTVALPIGPAVAFTISVDDDKKEAVNVALPGLTKVIPDAPTFAVGQCSADSLWPSDPTITEATTTGVDYSVSWAIENDKVIFESIAASTDGYIIDKDSLPSGWSWDKREFIAVWETSVDASACSKAVVPVSPTITPGVCTAGSTTPSEATVALPTTEGLTYSSTVTASGSKSTVTVTASRKDGFYINGGALPAGWVYNMDGTATYTAEVTGDCSTSSAKPTADPTAKPTAKPTTKKPGLPKTGVDN